MPRITRKPNKQLKQIVLEETDDGRDIVRYLKSVFVEVEDAPRLFGLIPDDYARTHKIAAARILARLGLEEGRRYLDWNYVQTPFRRVHPEDENDPPKREMAKTTADLYRLVNKKTNDGSDIMIHFIEIMKGYHPEYKPHLRMAAAKELVRQIEFDYDESAEPQPSDTVRPECPPVQESRVEESVSTASAQPDPVEDPAPQPAPTTESYADAPAHTESPSDTAKDLPHNPPKLITNPYRDYSDLNCADEAESIYRSIIHRASNRPTLASAKYKAEQLIEDFNRFAQDRDPGFDPVAVPDNLLTRSLTQRMEDPESYIFDPADYYDLDRDYFYHCMCGGCEECDELDYFFESMRELDRNIELLLEDP